MYLMYVDESGDPGMSAASPSPYFVLTGLVVHELDWHSYLQQILDFRKLVDHEFHFPAGAEMHAGPLIYNSASKIPVGKRLNIIRDFADKLATMDNLRIINVAIKKRRKPPSYDIFAVAWRTLIQRFEDTLEERNFPGPKSYAEKGMIFPDQTSQGKLTQLLDAMRQANPHRKGAAREQAIVNMVEEPVFCNSATSHYIQAADVASYLAYQYLAPNTIMKHYTGYNYFTRLDPVLLKAASNKALDGIVHL